MFPVVFLVCFSSFFSVQISYLNSTHIRYDYEFGRFYQPRFHAKQTDWPVSCCLLMFLQRRYRLELTKQIKSFNKRCGVKDNCVSSFNQQCAYVQCISSAFLTVASNIFRICLKESKSIKNFFLFNQANSQTECPI